MNPDNIKKILIIRLSSLGDILLTTPLIRSLKVNYSPLQIDFLLRTQYKDTLINNPYISNLRLLERNKDKNKELIKILQSENYDLTIDLQNNRRSDYISSKLKCKTVKFYKHSIDKFLLVNFKINRLKEIPQIPIRYANSLNNFSLDDKGLDLFTKNSASTLLSEKQNYIGFAPGSRHFTKMWPKKYYIELGNLLKSDNFSVVIFGGKSDASICKEIASQIPGSLNLCGNDEILQTAADIKKCKAIVCNDSGLMHAACAVNTPVMAFFGSTVKEFGFAPYKNKNLILENNSLSCRPCSHIGKNKCPKQHFKCMLELTPELAHKQLKILLKS